MKKEMSFRDYIKSNRVYINNYSKMTYGKDINKELGRIATRFEKQSPDIRQEIVDTFNYIVSCCPDNPSDSDRKMIGHSLYEMVIDLTYQL